MCMILTVLEKSLYRTRCQYCTSTYPLLKKSYRLYYSDIVIIIKYITARLEGLTQAAAKTLVNKHYPQYTKCMMVHATRTGSIFRK
jgi:hypothetical protein